MGERLKDPDKSFACSFSDCKASFSKAWKLEAHQCKHTGLKPFACETCAKKYCTRYQLNRHQLSHSGVRPYLCSLEGCAEAFATVPSLKNHTARVHQHKETLYVCNYEGCGKEFPKKRQLRTHQCEHTHVFPFECHFEGCGKKYAASQTLKRHEKVHNGYQCIEDGCPFNGKTWTEYQVHRKAEHREILQCDSCQKVFHEAWFLQKHKQFVHSGQRGVFKCTKEECQKTYKTQFGLQSHVLSYHEGVRSFVCPHDGCSKAFAMEESLKRHAVVHDPQKKKLPKTKRKKAAGRSKAPGASKLCARLQNVSLKESTAPNDPNP